MEDNFDPETGECEGGMRNISGDDDDDDDADVAFGPLIRTRDERKGVERRGDGQRERERERERGINSRVVKIPDAAAPPTLLCSSLTHLPLAPSHGT